MPLLPRRLRTGGARAPGLAALYLVAATSPRVAAFLLLPVYAFKLSPSELAAYGIAIAMAQLIGIICDFGVLEGMGIMYFELPEEERHSFLKTTMVLSRLTALVLMIPIGLLLAAFWEPLFGDGLPLNPGLFLILAFTFLQRGNTLAGGVYRVRNLHGHFATTKIVPAMVQTVAGLLFVFVLDWGAVGAIAAAPTGFLVSIIVAGIASRRAFEPSPFVRITREQATKIIARGVPTLPEQLSSWGQLLSLRPLLALFATVQETASFVFSNAPAQIVAPFNEAYAQYVTPKYYQSCADDDTATVRSLRDMTSLSIGFGAIATMGAIVIFDPIFEHFAPAPYRQGAGLAAIGLAGILLRGPMGLLVHNVRIEDRRVALVAAVVVATGVAMPSSSCWHRPTGPSAQPGRSTCTPRPVA